MRQRGPKRHDAAHEDATTTAAAAGAAVAADTTVATSEPLLGNTTDEPPVVTPDVTPTATEEPTVEPIAEVTEIAPSDSALVQHMAIVFLALGSVLLWCLSVTWFVPDNAFSYPTLMRLDFGFYMADSESSSSSYRECLVAQWLFFLATGQYACWFCSLCMAMATYTCPSMRSGSDLTTRVWFVWCSLIDFQDAILTGFIWGLFRIAFGYTHMLSILTFMTVGGIIRMLSNYDGDSYDSFYDTTVTGLVWIRMIHFLNAFPKELRPGYYTRMTLCTVLLELIQHSLLPLIRHATFVIQWTTPIRTQRMNHFTYDLLRSFVLLARVAVVVLFVRFGDVGHEYFPNIART